MSQLKLLFSLLLCTASLRTPNKHNQLLIPAPDMCILIILPCILLSHTHIRLMLRLPRQPGVAAPPPRTLMQALGQVMSAAAAGHRHPGTKWPQSPPRTSDVLGEFELFARHLCFGGSPDTHHSGRSRRDRYDLKGVTGLSCLSPSENHHCIAPLCLNLPVH